MHARWEPFEKIRSLGLGLADDVGEVLAAGAVLFVLGTVLLALGCALFLVAGAVPWLGDGVTFVVGLVGFGAVIGTRAAGLVRPRNGQSYATL
jgi:membrane protein implicated in regulation of membrane protease activity